MDLNNSKIDTKAETDGVWVDLDDETSILIARYLNPKHRAFVQKRMEPYRRLQRLNKLDDSVVEKIELEALAKYVLIDWKGLKDNGKTIKYSQEKALELLSDPTLVWLVDMVKEMSNDMSMFRQEMLEESRENVKK